MRSALVSWRKYTDESTTKFLFHAEKDEYMDPYASAKIDPSANWLSRVLNILRKIYFSWTTAISAIILLNQFDQEIVYYGNINKHDFKFDWLEYKIEIGVFYEGGHLKMNSPLNRNRI